jgi:hypothetical protein
MVLGDWGLGLEVNLSESSKSRCCDRRNSPSRKRTQVSCNNIVCLIMICGKGKNHARTTLTPELQLVEIPRAGQIGK